MVLFVFLLLMTLGLFMVSTRVAESVQERIQLQVAANSSAMSGTRVQALGLGFTAITNDWILYHFGRLMADLLDPEDWPDIPDEICSIEKIKKAQNTMDTALPTAIELATIVTGLGNNVAFAYPEMTRSTFKLALERPFYVLTLIQIRTESDIAEHIVSVTSSHFSATEHASDLLGFPKKDLQGYAGSAPFYVFESDPRDGELDLGWRAICTLVPGPFWQNRLTGTGYIPKSDLEKYFEMYMAKVADSAIEAMTNEVKSAFLEAIGEEEGCD